MLFDTLYSYFDSGFLSAKAVLSDHNDEGSGPDPFARGFRGIEIVNCAAGGVPPVQGVARRLIRAVGHRLVELAVIDAGERAVLINDAGNGIRKGWMADSVEHHRADCDLSGIGLSSGLGGDEAGEQIHLRAAAGRAALNAHGGERLRARFPIDRETVFLLEETNGLFRSAAVYAVHRSGIIAPVLQLRLDLAHSLPAAPPPVARGIGGCERDQHHRGDGENQGDDCRDGSDSFVFHTGRSFAHHLN